MSMNNPVYYLYTRLGQLEIRAKELDLRLQAILVAPFR